MIGRSSRYGLTPQASIATASRSPDSRPNPTRVPTRSPIGMVRPRACGASRIRMWAAVDQATPLATSRSSCSISGGNCSRNVKMRIAISVGGMISRMT